MAVKHVCDDICSIMLLKRNESDLRFSQTRLKNHFREFRQHAVRLADAFQLLDNQKTFSRDGNRNRGKRKAQATNSGKPGKAANAGSSMLTMNEKDCNKDAATKLPAFVRSVEGK